MSIVNPYVSMHCRSVLGQFGSAAERKGNEEYIYIYSAIYYASIVSKRSDMDRTVLPANYTMPAFPSQAFT